EWQRRYPQIGDVRGLGAMLAIELVEDPASKRPAPELASAVAKAAAERGLLLLKAGTHSNCIRVLCPLVIDDDELEEALGAWGEALEAVLAYPLRGVERSLVVPQRSPSSHACTCRRGPLVGGLVSGRGLRRA